MNQIADEIHGTPHTTATAPRRVATFRLSDEGDLDVALGREIGYEFARFGLKLPEGAALALREGFAEAEGRFRQGGRRDSTPWERKLLRLRASAWRRNRIVDPAVTAEYLEAIQVRHCPVTRCVLTHGTGGDTDGTIDRVFNGGAYAVGNLAMMSARANHAKANRMPDELITEAMGGSDAEGLSNMEWMRLAAMTCAAAPPGYMDQRHMPMLVYPPNGLLVSNAFVVLQMTFSALGVGWVKERAIADFRNCCVGKRRKKAFHDMLEALCSALHRTTKGVTDPELYRFAICDAWLQPMVYERYALVMSGASKDEVLEMLRVARREQQALRSLDKNTLDKWSMETRGYAN